MSLLCLPRNPVALGERLHDALAVTPTLIADVIHEACRRFPARGPTGTAERVEQLIQLSAWTDAALTLIEIELPQWRVRRLAYDSGEWHCALSRERELPDWLDQSIEGSHADLAIAILTAFLEVKCLNDEAPRSSVPRAPQGAIGLYEPVLGDNFG
jgi:hypothetical protein